MSELLRSLLQVLDFMVPGDITRELEHGAAVWCNCKAVLKLKKEIGALFAVHC